MNQNADTPIDEPAKRLAVLRLVRAARRVVTCYRQGDNVRSFTSAVDDLERSIPCGRCLRRPCECET